jgi:hypothetical protein
MALPAADDFNRSENPLATHWTAPDGLLGSKFICANQLTGQGESTFQLEYWSDDVFDGNHKSTITLTGSNLAGAYGGVAVRVQASGQNAYVFGDVLGAYVISKMASGALSTLQTCTGTPTVGDILKLEISGATLTAYVDSGAGFVQVGTANNSDLTGGSAGLWGYGGIGIYVLTNWAGDDLSAAPPAVVTSASIQIAPVGFV